MRKDDRWQAFLDYGTLFRPWIAGREADWQGPSLSSGDIAPLRALTERYGTSTALGWVLRQRPLEDSVKTYAELALLYGRGKAERQLQALDTLVQGFNAAGVKPLLLKGSAAQVAGVYPDPGFRLMADLDLLVSPCDIAPGVEAAERAGFLLVPETRSHASHALQLFNSKLGLLLELHHQLARVYQKDNFPAGAVLDAAREVEFRGGRVLLPDWPHHAALTILHAVAWDRSRYMALIPMKALLDLAALKASDVNLSWTAVREEMARAGEEASLVHFEVLFRTLFDAPLTDMRIPRIRRRLIEGYYAAGARYPMLHHIGLFQTSLRKRLLRAKKEPNRVLKLLSPAFYARFASDTRKAFNSDAPLN